MPFRFSSSSFFAKSKIGYYVIMKIYGNFSEFLGESGYKYLSIGGKPSIKDGCDVEDILWK